MIFLPFENITYRKNLKEDEVLKRLSELTEPVRNPFFNTYYLGDKKIFGGQIEGQNFKIIRKIIYRNSFQPIISGTIKSDGMGTVIYVKMRLRNYTLIFLILWCSICLYLSVPFSIMLINFKNIDPVELIPFGMLLFAYLMTMVGFKIESRRSKKDLQKVVESEVI